MLTQYWKYLYFALGVLYSLLGPCRVRLGSTSRVSSWPENRQSSQHQDQTWGLNLEYSHCGKEHLAHKGHRCNTSGWGTQSCRHKCDTNRILFSLMWFILIIHHYVTWLQGILSEQMYISKSAVKHILDFPKWNKNKAIRNIYYQ